MRKKHRGTKTSTIPPRSRKRKGRGNLHKAAPKVSGFISMGKEIGDPMAFKEYGPSANRIRGAKIRKSTRWISGEERTERYSFPYIDLLGRFSGSTLFMWNTDYRSYIASVVSTIAKRLEQYCFRHNDAHLVLKNSDRIVRVSYYYATSKNSYFWDRVLYFARNLEKYGTQLHTCLLNFLSKTDASKRFVYGHVCNQTQWLLFRAERPRDKSAYEAQFPRRKKLYISHWAEAVVYTKALVEIAKAISHL